MKEMVVLENVSKTFKVKEKKPGFLESVKSIFSPTFVNKDAVNDISFRIKKGEIVGFIGPNGAGKSTTIKMMSGILWPDNGSIIVNGMNPQKERKKLAYTIGTIFGQRQQLWLHLPALDSFELFRHMYEVPEKIFRKRLSEYITLFEVGDYVNSPVRSLSLGQRMRCEFIAALLHNPEILFLDEPTIGLDIVAKRKIRESIIELNRKYQTTVILTSHDLDDVEKICNRLIIINKGDILFDDLTAKLRERVHEKRITVKYAELPNNKIKIKGTTVLSSEKTLITYLVDLKKNTVQQVTTQLFLQGAIEDIQIEEPPIEEIIEELYA